MLFVANVDNFINGLTQQETALPNIVGGANYWSSKAKIMGLVEDATQAVVMGGDYKKAQTFLNATLEMMNNQTNYFQMPFNPSFTAEQLYETPSILRVTDTSTGGDANIAGRRVYLRKDDGDYLVPNGTTTDYIEWDITESYIDIDVLDKDYALETKVEWIENDPTPYTIRITEDGNNRITEDSDTRITQ